MDIQTISKTDKVKVCRWRLDDNCTKISSKLDDFRGACCKVCIKYKNEVYYMTHKDDLLQRSKRKYVSKGGRPSTYVKRTVKVEE